MLVTYLIFHLTSITKPFLSTQSTKITTSKSVTIAYTHPTSYTNTLNHYNFVLKQIKKLKTKLTPITKFKLNSNKNINKNIKPNNKSHEDVQMNECNYVTTSFK